MDVTPPSSLLLLPVLLTEGESCGFTLNVRNPFNMSQVFARSIHKREERRGKARKGDEEARGEVGITITLCCLLSLELETWKRLASSSNLSLFFHLASPQVKRCFKSKGEERVEEEERAGSGCPLLFREKETREGGCGGGGRSQQITLPF